MIQVRAKKLELSMGLQVYHNDNKDTIW
jgi:hypothetical protein